MIDAFSFNFRVIVPEDCVGDVTKGPQFANLRDVGRSCACVVDLRMCLDRIA